MSETNTQYIISNKDNTAYREFCYRWTCSCGHQNRVGELIAGQSNECGGCKKLVRIGTIVYDNGCIVRVGM